MVKKLPCSAGNVASITGWGTSIPYATEKLSLCTPTIEAQAPHLESVRHNKRSHMVQWRPHVSQLRSEAGKKNQPCKNCDRINLCCFKHRDCDHLLERPQETNTHLYVAFCKWRSREEWKISRGHIDIVIDLWMDSKQKAFSMSLHEAIYIYIYIYILIYVYLNHIPISPIPVAVTSPWTCSLVLYFFPLIDHSPLPP